MTRALLATLALALAGCEQYHPTALDNIRPASERDREFAAKPGAETSARRVMNTAETRAGGIVEPMLDARPGLELWRLSIAGPVAIAEGSLDGRAFAGVYWTRDDRVIRRREMTGAEISETFSPSGRKRLRATGDLRNLVSARDLVASRRSPPTHVRFRDAGSGRDDGGAAAVREAVGTGAPIEESWAIGDVVAVLSPDALWVVGFDELEMVEISRYPR